MFSGKAQSIATNADFWTWFQKNEARLFSALKAHNNVEKDFVGTVLPKLHELREGFWLQAGMENEHTAELIVTADGAVSELVFVEELIAAAPDLANWKFTAHKPLTDAEDEKIILKGHEFHQNNLFFYANEATEYPDNINITIVHPDLNEDNRNEIATGVFLFLDIYLGELNMVTKVDHVNVVGVAGAGKEIIPMAKLKDFINWREKEFLEKYEDHRHDTENDEYASLRANAKDGNAIIATMNMTLLKWEAKASHPWRMDVVVPYDGSNTGGMPDEKAYSALNDLEDEIMARLKDEAGYLNVGRESGGNHRIMYFACKDLRQPAKVMDALRSKYAASGQFDISFDIFKDKYWRSLENYARVS